MSDRILHQYRGEGGATYTVVETRRELLAKSMHGVKRGFGTSSFKLDDGREIIEVGDDDEEIPSVFLIVDTDEKIYRVE